MMAIKSSSPKLANRSMSRLPIYACTLHNQTIFLS
jgi:hypothetical protein